MLSWCDLNSRRAEVQSLIWFCFHCEPGREVNAIRQFAEVVEAMLHLVTAHDDDAQAGFAAAQRLADRSRGHGFKIASAGQGVAVIVAGEKMFHAEFLKQAKIGSAARARDVEVFIRLIGGFQKPGMMREDHDGLRPALAGPRQFRPQPAFLRGQLIRGLLRRMNDHRVEHDADEVPMAEGIVVGPEVIGVNAQRGRRGSIFYVVVADNIVNRNGGIYPAHDALKLGDLSGIARLVHEVAGNHDKRRTQPIDRGHGEFEVGGLLGEIPVGGEHAKLRVAELDEEERIGGSNHIRRQQQDEAEADSEVGVSFHERFRVCAKITLRAGSGR